MNLWMHQLLFTVPTHTLIADPRLTARHGGGHLPVRIVMSQTLNLPEVANLWDISEVRTIVATQRGARKSFQKLLASKGVEVVEFDILNPRDLMEYCYDRGYLSILWECGGALSAPAISSGVIHKVLFNFFSWRLFIKTHDAFCIFSVLQLLLFGNSQNHVKVLLTSII